MMDTWTTPFGVKLTVAGKGGPWITITDHSAKPPPAEGPLNIPLPRGVDAGWYYRNGWQPKGNDDGANIGTVRRRGQDDLYSKET